MKNSGQFEKGSEPHNKGKFIYDNLDEYIRNCPNCGCKIEYSNKYTYYRGTRNNSNCKYCSAVSNIRKVEGSFWLGKQLSKEHRNKIRIANTKNFTECDFIRNCPGCNKKMKYTQRSSKLDAERKGRMCMSCAKKGHVPWNKGKVGIFSHDDKTKKQISEKLMGIERPSGEDHHCWKSHKKTNVRVKKRHISGYEKFRKDCFKRDDYTCQISGQVGGRLVVHHLRSYKEFPMLRTEISNGITVSEKIHKQFHRIYGNTGFNEEDFHEFSKLYISENF